MVIKDLLSPSKIWHKDLQYIVGWLRKTFSDHPVSKMDGCQRYFCHHTGYLDGNKKKTIATHPNTKMDTEIDADHKCIFTHFSHMTPAPTKKLPPNLATENLPFSPAQQTPGSLTDSTLRLFLPSGLTSSWTPSVTQPPASTVVCLPPARGRCTWPWWTRWCTTSTRTGCSQGVSNPPST